jgi:hypothetical protein
MSETFIGFDFGGGGRTAHPGGGLFQEIKGK